MYVILPKDTTMNIKKQVHSLASTFIPVNDVYFDIFLKFHSHLVPSMSLCICVCTHVGTTECLGHQPQ